jgi:phenylalanyl-tRNA synthetase alpha chain
MSAPVCLTGAQLARDLVVPDLSDPADGPHAIQLLAEHAAEALTGTWGCETRWCRGPRVVTIADNYDHLGYEPAAVTREARYTRYVDGGRMLRSHSTAMVPPALRDLAATAGAPGDVLLVCPGLAYRRDAIDWQHTGTPHQLDMWRISRAPVGEEALREMIATLLAALVPGRASRHHRCEHPYTTAGRQVDVAHDGDWVEVWECGLADPDVLAGAGLPGYHGLALGLGLDRLLMLRKGIPDIRLLRSADPRVAGQMRDLAPYQPVSAMPAVRRDLSVAVDPGEDDETLGDRVREALGADADCVEEVTVLSSTARADLPEAALARLGARPGQRNVLVRVVLRHLDRTLTDGEANALRDRVYAAIHQGTRHQWATGQAMRCTAL